MADETIAATPDWLDRFPGVLVPTIRWDLFSNGIALEVRKRVRELAAEGRDADPASLQLAVDTTHPPGGPHRPGDVLVRVILRAHDGPSRADLAREAEQARAELGVAKKDAERLRASAAERARTVEVLMDKIRRLEAELGR